VQNDKDKGNFSKLISTVKKSGEVRANEMDRSVISSSLVEQLRS